MTIPRYPFPPFFQTADQYPDLTLRLLHPFIKQRLEHFSPHDMVQEICHPNLAKMNKKCIKNVHFSNSLIFKRVL